MVGGSGLRFWGLWHVAAMVDGLADAGITALPLGFLALSLKSVAQQMIPSIETGNIHFQARSASSE